MLVAQQSTIILFHIFMKTLFLTRHAKSSWDAPGLSDEKRPLNSRGERDAPKMGKRLVSRGVQPELIVSSPALRAYSTAIKIAAETGYAEKAVQVDKRLYFEGIGAALKIIQSLNLEVQSAMLVGHNPVTTALANYLANTNIANIPTCGIAEIVFDTESWQEVDSGTGMMKLFDYPKRIDD